MTRAGAIGDSRLNPQGERKERIKKRKEGGENFNLGPGVMAHACKSSQNSRPASSPAKDFHLPVHTGILQKKE